MTTDLHAELLKAADTAMWNRHGHRFITAVRTFVTALKRMPDAGPREYSHEQLDAIRGLADRVAIAIDDRLEDDDDSQHVQQELAGMVYAIRQAVEEIHLWERHFLRA